MRAYFTGLCLLLLLVVRVGILRVVPEGWCVHVERAVLPLVALVGIRVFWRISGWPEVHARLRILVPMLAVGLLGVSLLTVGGDARWPILVIGLAVLAPTLVLAVAAREMDGPSSASS